MNHVAVERCHQCGASFPLVQESTVAEASAKTDAARASDPALANRAAPAHDSIPVALSTRIDADVEPAGDARPGTASAALRERQAPPHPQPSTDHEAIAMPVADARPPAWRAPRRSGAPYVALAAVAVCVIAGAAYYAYDARLLPAVLDVPGALSTKDAASTATPSRMPPAAAPTTADGTTRTVPEAPSDATIAPAVTPPAAPPPGPAMAPAPKPQTAAPAPSQSPEIRASSQPLTTPPAASPQSSPATPARGTAAEETRSASRTARPAAREGNSRSQADKDALATQRLIERDLKGFLPPEHPQDRGSRSP